MLPDLNKKSIQYKKSIFKSKGDVLMFNPNSLFKKVWTTLLIFLLLYTAIIMPYKIALIDDDNDSFFVVDTAIDFMFLFDIFVNMNSPII